MTVTVTPEQAASALAAWTAAERAQFFEHLEVELRCYGQEHLTDEANVMRGHMTDQALRVLSNLAGIKEDD